MAHILAIRFSALGDIAMTIPVLYSFAHNYPEHDITLLSRSYAAPLLEKAPRNIHFLPINLGDYKGLNGIRKLHEELKLMQFDAVVDLHDVLRTKILRFLFKHDGLPVTSIDKGRHEKRQLTSAHHKELSQLTESPQRYAIALAELGYPFQIEFKSIYETRPALLASIAEELGEKGNVKWIGIAPFAAHKGKIYPLSLLEKVIAILNKQDDIKIFLFGAGEKETKWCKKWSESYSHVHSFVGKFKLSEELTLMSYLDVMLTMDSANMHLSSLVSTPTVSIWGATHPFAGFAGIQAPGSKIIQREMDCRPCSIFGNKACAKRNYDCLWKIEPQQVVDAVLEACNLRKS